MRYLIDGFNLIYKFPELEELMYRSELNAARSGLLKILENLKKIHKCSVHVVFDGKKNPGCSIRHENIKNMEIDYSHDQSADYLIKQFVKQAKQPKEITVITSDRDILFYINRFSAKKMTSENFAQMINRLFNEKEEEESLKEEMEAKINPRISDEELSYWQKMFSQRSN